jgi:Bacterial regulatory helix-turn-helix protein, lysR family
MDRLRDMELFARVVETGSFSAAARDLKMGQPAISKSTKARAFAKWFEATMTQPGEVTP